MKGIALVEKLKELGFHRELSINSSLDDFEILQIQALLENAHMIPESANVDSGESKPTSGIRRKPRKAGDKTSAPATPATVAETEEGTHSGAHSGAAAVADAETVEAETLEASEGEIAEPTEAEIAAEEAEFAAAEAAEGTPTIDEAEAGAALETESLELESAEAPAEGVELGIPTEEAAAPRMQPAPEGAAARAGTSPMIEPRPTRTPGRPAAKIVGRIDPSLLKPRPSQGMPPQPKEATATPSGISVSGSDADVRPTLKHNRSRALTRSDVSQSRDRLSSAQLREKEQSRVRRLTGPQRGGLGSMAARGGMPGPGGGGSYGSGGGSSRSGPSTHERRSQIVVVPPVTMRALSEALGLKVGDLVRTMLMQFQRMGVTPNTTITEEDAKLLALEHGFEIEVRSSATAEQEISAERERQESEDPTHLERRAPVIAFLGHVDHGKTSLIDAIRETNVAAHEAGGITQHMGAYRVTTRSGHPITILDTPGHEAFTEMRKRGAQSTDIVVLVVAGDDGVMPQTEEAYSHAKAAGVPVIVALNKSDKASDAQKERTIGQLAGLGLAPEDWHGVNWGGSTAVIETSATKKLGIEDLLERVWLETEVLDLKANPERKPEGVVIEAEKSGQRGIVATLLVQKGTLRRGDIILAGAGYGRVRNLSDDRGRNLDEAGPSLPVEVTGLSELPSAGDHFVVVEDLQQAADAAGERARKLREVERAGASREAVSLSNLFSRIKEGQTKEVKIVLKADVGGSLEVLKKELGSLTAKDSKGNEIQVKVIHSAVGAITEADVNLAAASGGIVVGFHVLASDSVRKLGTREGVEVHVYQILYEIVNDMRKAMEGLLSPIQKEVVLGHAETREVFRSSKIGNIAGCMVSDGIITRSANIRVIRNGAVVYSGKLDSLRRLKDDVRDVKAGFECGIKVANYEDIKKGDILEAFEIREERQLLPTSE